MTARTSALKNLRVWVEQTKCAHERSCRIEIVRDLEPNVEVRQGKEWTGDRRFEPEAPECRLTKLYDTKPKQGNSSALDGTKWTKVDPELLHNDALGEVMVIPSSWACHSESIISLPEKLCVMGDLDLRGCTNLACLPEKLVVAGDLYLAGCRSLRCFPPFLTVGGSLGGGGLRSLDSIHETVRVGGNIVIGHALICSIPSSWSIVDGRLDVQRCANLKCLPNELHVRGKLMLKGCRTLRYLPKQLRVEGDLDLRQCENLEEIHSNISVDGSVDLEQCQSLTKLPPGFCVERNFDLSHCISLTQLPRNIHVKGKLSLDGCEALSNISDGLEVHGPLVLNHCKSLEYLPDDMILHSHVELIGCTSLQGVPKNLNHINGSLTLSNCRFLKRLPEDLVVEGDLNLSNCTSLRSLPRGIVVRRRLDMRGCTSMKTIPENILSEGKADLSFCTSLREIPNQAKFLGTLDLTFCKSLTQLPETFEVHGNLSLLNCSAMMKLPHSLTVRGNLYIEEMNIEALSPRLFVDGDLHISRCRRLHSLPEGLSVSGKVVCEDCSSLAILPSQTTFSDDLTLKNCNVIQCLPSGIKVSNDLVLENCLLMDAISPDLQVGHSLIIKACPRLVSIPDRLLEWTPMSNGEPHTVYLERTGISHEALDWLSNLPLNGVRFQIELEAESASMYPVSEGSPACRFANLNTAIRFWIRAAGAAGMPIPVLELPSPNLRGVLLFLDKLREAKEFAFNESRKLLAVRVVQVIAVLARCDEIVKMEILQRMEDSVDTCHDKPIWALNQMELACRLASARGNEKALRNLGRSVMRLGIVHEHAEQKIRSLPFVDDVCVYLKFEIELRQSLDLPVSASTMFFPKFVKVHKDEIRRAEEAALSVSEDQFDRWLETWPDWQRFQRQKLAKETTWESILSLRQMQPENVRRVSEKTVLGEEMTDPVLLHGCLWSLQDLLRQWVETGQDLNNTPVTAEEIAALEVPTTDLSPPN